MEGRFIGKNIGLMVGKICDGNLKNCVDDWNVESGLNGLTLRGHCCFSSMRNSGDFFSQNYTFEHKNYWNDGSGLNGFDREWSLLFWLHEKFG